MVIILGVSTFRIFMEVVRELQPTFSQKLIRDIEMINLVQ